MSLLDSLRKGFGYFLLSMGISRPTRKPQAATKPTQQGNK
jgi:hypothetical protein